MPGSGALDGGEEEPASESSATMLGSHVHSPDRRRMVLLDQRVAVASDHADQNVSREPPEREVALGLTVDAKVLGPRFDGTRFLGRSAKRLGMLVERPDIQRVIRRRVGRSQQPDGVQPSHAETGLPVASDLNERSRLPTIRPRRRRAP